MKKFISSVLCIVLIFVLYSNVYAQNFSLPESLLMVNKNTELEIPAKAYVLMDANTGTLLLSSNEHERLYPASVTKIMTLLLVGEALENGKITKEMTVTCSDSSAEKGGSQIWLEPGETMSIDELLKATCISSANDASCLLAETIAGSEESFVAMMNEKASELNMNDTHFDNCTGLDDDTDEHKSSAYDIALMSVEILKHDILRQYMNIWMETLRNGETQLVNTNKLIRTYPGATGIKTGTTSKSGCSVSASAQRDGLELIAVIMGAENSKERFSGAKKLLDWGFANYEIYTLKTDDYSKIIKVNHGVYPYVNIEHGETKDVLINKGASSSITKSEVILNEIDAPLKKGQKIGQILFKSGEELIGTCDMICKEDIERMTVLNAVKCLFHSLNNNKI